MTALVDTIRKQQQETVLKWTQELCEALLKDFQRQSIERSTLSLLMCDKDEDHSIKYYQERIAEAERGENLYKFYPESGRKYHKIMMECDDGARSVHAFVDKKTGEVYKAASWKAPAKIVRYRLLEIASREECFARADWAGSYLYIR